MNEPRVIGMLGGMSWESSAQYYRLANELVRERLGGLHSARIVLASVDFADVEALQVAGRWGEAGQLLAEAAKGLEAAGAELLLICTNTMHKVSDQVQAAVEIPLLHLGDATAEALQVAGRWGEAGQLLAEAAKGLEAAGAELLLICTNTMHKVSDQVQAAVRDPAAAPGRRHRRGSYPGRAENGRAAGYGIHHGAGLLPRPAHQPRPAGAYPAPR
jgi:aspartate/glutamate racemase